jgi:3',5'-cyclic AMP phosphodiesterase CpdA
MAKLRIIHISDLHLFVDRIGNHRALSERAMTVRIMDRLGGYLERLPDDKLRKKAAELFHGINTHSEALLRALLRTLDELLADKAYSSVVLQTGDVSTFGALAEARFPEWEYWQGDALRARRDQATAWVDIFGNHDVWPGTLPIFGAPFIEGIVRTFRDRHFPRSMPSVTRVEVDGITLELHAINSVLCGAGDNTWAVGELACDCVDPSGPESPDALVALEHNTCAGEAIRLLLMHHPPHHFVKPGGGSERGLRDAERLGTWLAERGAGARFQLVLAGHRHAIDPPVQPIRGYEQPPLPACSLQLVCATPTQESATEPSFSVYELRRTERGVELSRQIYARKGRFDRRFQASEGGDFYLTS